MIDKIVAWLRKIGNQAVQAGRSIWRRGRH